MIKDSLFLLISNFLGSVGPEGGPLMIMKDSWFLLISNCLVRNRESNYFSWWAPQETGLFQNIEGSNIIGEILTMTLLKLVIYFC